ncbi:MAG: beta-N-acetylhexosaminidase [Acidobacteriota bacterium]|nr:beta-N-acetylhexosaminidase [Acidobacteriota bacterium]
MQTAAWVVFALAGVGQTLAVSPLSSRGYAVLPQPQQVELGEGDFSFGAGWSLALAPGLEASDVSVQTLQEDLQARFGITLAAGGPRVIRLNLKPGSVAIGAALDHDRAQLAGQAYRMELAPSRIELTANSAPGLFYAVTTLVQLVQNRNGGFRLPAGRITDWPDLQLRQIYWDDAHHLDRLPVLKAALRQAAFYKINGFALKLEGHFRFKSAPAVVEPYALSPAELQELTDYGLRYHVQLIPYLDGPGHIAFILKHPEYAKFREFASSNYELCSTNPEAVQFLLAMFHDLLDANKGGKYVYLSTDEAYYIGLADTAQCREKPAGSPSQLLASFVAKVADDLHARGRNVIFWGEYPLKPQDISSLPAHAINGETYGPEFDPVFHRRGIKQMIYTSTEGEEPLFPDYFVLPASQRMHPERLPRPHLEEIFRTISLNPAREQTDIMGMMNAGWADRGLHPETFWLGYAAAAAWGWHPASPDPAEARDSFYAQFYGPHATRMDRLYQLMSLQAQFWSDSWDTSPSDARKPIWGNSYRIFNPPERAKEQILPLPPVKSPSETRRLELASEAVEANEELLGLLHENLRRVDFNRYNVEVFLSIAQLYRHNLNMLAGLGEMRQIVESAGRESDAKKAIAEYDRAIEIAVRLRDERTAVLASAAATWAKTWQPRAPAANGRTFLHEVDDVKDHLPDRTIGMEYLVYRELLLPLGDWVEKIRSDRNRLAEDHRMPIDAKIFDWKFGVRPE